jgi:acetyl-CoA carboxylase biotin carboxyl carrier protein
MTLDEIRQILEMMKEHELTEFELERDNVKLRLRKQDGRWVSSMPAVQSGYAPSVIVAPAAPVAAAAPQAGPPAETPGDVLAADEEMELAVVKSPIVGTFYRSAEPGAKPYAEVGDTVKKGQVLCIIEAMKLMNEINAECDGEIVKVYVENGQAVQYGERLFALKPL